MKGEVSVMAHSLGNMVVSSAIALEGMDVDRYFLLDAAVAAEAYDGATKFRCTCVSFRLRPPLA